MSAPCTAPARVRREHWSSPSASASRPPPGWAARVDRLGPARALALTAVALAATYAAMPAAVPALPALLAVLAVLGLVQQLALTALVSLLNDYRAAPAGGPMAANSAIGYAGYMTGTAAMGPGVRCRRLRAPSRRSASGLLLVAAAVAARR